MIVLQYFDMKLYPKEELCIVIIIMACLAHLSVGQNDCSPAFTLPNILKDQVSLQYSDGSQQTNSYLFFSGMFSGQPVIGYSISQLGIQLSTSSLNFYLDVQIQDMFIYFYFNSPNFKWTVASVIFWITSRVDILVTKTVLINMAKDQNNTKSFTIEAPSALIDSKSTHVTFLAGIYSSFESNLSISIYPGPVSSTAGSVIVYVGSKVTVNNITVISVIYNPAIGQFLSSTGTLSYKTVTNQFFNLFNNILPIYYILTGINSFTLTGNNANNFQFNLQVVNSTILQSSSTVSFDFLGISYVTIGAVTNSVCSPCNNFISNGQCMDSCPSLTYPYTFADNGKACLSCDFRVGQILNTLGNGCNCLPGFELISANQCVNSNSGNTVCTGMNVIQNGSTCICSPGTFNISGVCGSCPAGQVYQGGSCVSGSNCPSNSNFSPALARCICDSGYMNISNTCVACQPGQYYENAERTCKCIGLNQQVNRQGSCVCLAGYHSINGFCISCPSGTVFDGSSCVTQACPTNQILVNGSCTCDSTSIAVGSLCIKCNSGTFPNRATNLCDSCIVNCVSCLNKVTCSQCNTGFIFNFASLSCLNPNAPQTVAMMVSIKDGFPWYTMQGIITDFLINATNINVKSKSDLMRMVSLSFSDVATIPLRIYYSQNPAQFNNIRVAFYYKGLIPLANFTVQYKFSDPSINLREDQTVSYQYSTTNFQIRSS